VRATDVAEGEKRNWANKHLVAVILSVGVSLWLVLMGVNIIFQEFPISDQLSTLLSTALGATVGALAVYLGGRGSDEHDEVHYGGTYNNRPDATGGDPAGEGD
jgi:uncharacterized membrane-anchored protein